MTEEDIDELKIFHNAVREYIISLLLFILLYVISYGTVSWFKKRIESEDCVTDEDDAWVFRIVLWLCTFTLAVSACAVLLLPISIISNEVLLHHPHSYNVKWLNSSLIHGLWNQVFLFSNLGLFVMMPFAYFFTESEGFSGSKNGIMARIKETAVMLVILGIIVFGVYYVIEALVDSERHSHETLLDLWHIYLPNMYSLISFLGVLFLLICTPVGFACMFTSMGNLVLKPQFLRDINEQLSAARLNEEALKRKIHDQSYRGGKIANGHISAESLQEQLEQTQNNIKELEKRQQISCWRTLVYPVVLLLSLLLTVFGVLMVVQNMFQLLVGIKALPVGAKEMVLGITSLSALGWPGSVLETILILYLMSASVVGFYSLPFCCQILPRCHDTSMRHIILNCSVLLILSSALPVLSRTLGITNFDLVGDFGTMDWLGSFYIIFSYNGIFAVATVLCLINKFTASVRRGILVKLKTAFSTMFSAQRKRSTSYVFDIQHND